VPCDAAGATLRLGGPGRAVIGRDVAVWISPVRPESTRSGATRPVARIAGLGVALPVGVETIGQIEARIEELSGRLPVPRGTLAAISGIRSRGGGGVRG
jgi:hypothetical protein